MKYPVIKAKNLSEEEFNILYNVCKCKVSKIKLTQFYLTSLDNGLAIISSVSHQVRDTEIECFSYSEFMQLYKECSLEHIL